MLTIPSKYQYLVEVLVLFVFPAAISSLSFSCRGERQFTATFVKATDAYHFLHSYVLATQEVKKKKKKGKTAL